MTALDRLYVDGEILLYGDVGDPWGWGDGFTPSDVAQALAMHGDDDIVVRVNSGGGIAFDGVAIYSLLRAHALTGGKVAIVIDGIAASAASLIAMAGDSIEMRAGAMMMIHDASGITWGTAEDHEKSRAMLDKLSAQYARVYSDRSGRPEGEVRDLMLAETWFTAEEAVEAKLATAVLSDAALSTASFDYRVYAHAPDGLPRRVKPTSPAATAAQPKEPNMSVRPDPAAPAKDVDHKDNLQNKDVQPAAKAWTASFYKAAEKSGLEIAALNGIVEECDSLADAQAKLIDAMADAGNRNKPKSGPRTEVVADARDRFNEGAEKAVLARIGHTDGERNEFSSMTMRELARASIEMRGDRFNGRSVEALMRQAFAAAGGHSTSDFVNILANVANKSMLKGFEEAEETFEAWTGKGTLPDFKPQRRVDLNLFSSLKQVQEGAEYEQGTIGDRGETVQLAKYGRTFHITWEAMINDDMDVLSKIPSRMGRAAKRTIGDLVYAILTSNPNMSDGTALFHATHGNLATGGGSALSESSLDTGRVAMAKQKDPDSKASGGLNIRPKYLIVPVALEGTARLLMNSRTAIAQSNPAVASKVTGLAEVVSDARLDTASATAWYLSSAPQAHDTIEVDYLDGQEQPEMFEDESFNIDGVSYKVRLCAGVKALDFRPLYKGVGA
jgi:ATP-dependent protease ClpP protease subunit